MSEIKIDWQVEQDRFERVAFSRAMGAAQKAFRKWHSRKRDDAVQECLSKMWDQWARLLMRARDPEPMIGPLIYWAIKWVQYDRRIAGRAPHPDVFDYRSGLKRHLLCGQGKASPTDRSDPLNGWIDWAIPAKTDDPAELAAALEAAGLTLDQYLAT